MSKRRDIMGQRFGRLVALSREPWNGFASRWKCKCDCGTEKVIQQQGLLEGLVLSCGCLHKERITRHGLSYTRLYGVWIHMLRRCYYTKHPDYFRYGGRGIRVCEGLRSTPLNLLDVIGPQPARLEIDRINNNGHYSCGRCAECLRCGHPFNIRWATVKQQSRNRRSNRLLTYNGITKCMSEWAEEFGIPYRAFRYRVDQGVDPFVSSRQKVKK